MLDLEQWLPIQGYNGWYEISSKGNIRSIERVVIINQKKKTIKAKVLKIRLNNCGYSYVRLCMEGKVYTLYVHRLVAEHFIPNPNFLPQVNHKSGDKKDNSLDNLEWVDISDNVKHAYETGLNKHKGKDHTFAISIIDEMTGDIFPTIKEFCRQYHIKYSTGRNALNGQGSLSNYIDLTEHSFKKIYKVA